MTSSSLLPTLYEFKFLAKQLRARLQGSGTHINHSRSLEMTAKQWGFANWNTLCAAVAHPDISPTITRNDLSDCPLIVGQSITGKYLGIDFSASVLGIEVQTGGRYRLSLHCDQPIDVVKFDSFSSWRQRLHCTVDASGRSTEKTSDGTAQMILDL